MLRKLFGRQDKHGHHPAKATPLVLERKTSNGQGQSAPSQQVFSKVFRYRLPDGHTKEPVSVEIVGSFTNWKRVPLLHHGKLDGWHTIIHHIPGNRTHRYMLLVDGRPTLDCTCDGLVAPHGPQEEMFVLQTDKGPRVLMLFAQTK